MCMYNTAYSTKGVVEFVAVMNGIGEWRYANIIFVRFVIDVKW